MVELFVILLWLDGGKKAFPHPVNCCGQLKQGSSGSGQVFHGFHIPCDLTGGRQALV